MRSANVTAPTDRCAATSPGAKLVNIFVDPGEVFEEVVAAPHSAANWLVPVFLNCCAGAVLFLMGSAGANSPQRTNDETPASLTVPATADMGASFNEPGNPTVVRPDGLAAIVIICFAGTFWSALLLWLGGRLFLKTRFSYLKTVEIAALTTVIPALGGVVTALLVLATGNGFARPALSLLVGEFNPANRIHEALATINLFHIWMAAVLSIGLARLSEVPVREVAAWVFGYWIVLRIALLLLA